jgi:hypothetical protein
MFIIKNSKNPSKNSCRSTWKKNDEILQQLYHEHKYLIMLWKGEVVVGDCMLEEGLLAIYWQTENEVHLRWGVGVHLRHSFHIFGNMGVKQVGPSGGRQTEVCMDHSS